MTEGSEKHPRVAYLTLQAATQGQAAYAHVHEIIKGLRLSGTRVELFEPRYQSEHPGALTRFREFFCIQRQLIRQVEAGAFDLIYIRSHPFAWWAAGAARRLRIPVVQECNGMTDDFFIAWPRTRMASPLIRALSYRQFRDASAVIAGSGGLRDWLNQTMGVEAFVVPNGADTDLFCPQPRPANVSLPKRYVIFFGAFSPWQGLQTTLAAAQSGDWPSGIELVMVGDGVLRPEVEQASKAHPHIHYLGKLPYREVPPLVANALCSLLNKEQPEFRQAGISPLKLYESMACAIPIIATQHMPGLTEVVRDNHAGLIIPPNNPTALCLAITHIATHPAQAQAMATAAQTYATKEASWKARAQTTEKILACLLGS